jgi:hypothetical protein
LKKTPYELLVRRKPNIAYFRVFDCKCYIFKKGTRLSKFKKKCDEGFLLGYSSTCKAYRVYNKTHGIVDDVRGAKLDEAMKHMEIGDIRPREEQDQDDDSIRVFPSSSVTNEDQPSTNGPEDQSQVQQV